MYQVFLLKLRHYLGLVLHSFLIDTNPLTSMSSIYPDIQVLGLALASYGFIMNSPFLGIRGWHLHQVVKLLPNWNYKSSSFPESEGTTNSRISI